MKAKLTLSKYVIEFVEDSFRGATLTSCFSDTPFLAFHVGDYIAPATCGEGRLEAGKCYQVVKVQHIITKPQEGSHKLLVCVKSVRYPG